MKRKRISQVFQLVDNQNRVYFPGIYTLCMKCGRMMHESRIGEDYPRCSCGYCQYDYIFLVKYKKHVFGECNSCHKFKPGDVRHISKVVYHYTSRTPDVANNIIVKQYWGMRDQVVFAEETSEYRFYCRKCLNKLDDCKNLTFLK